MTFIAGRLAFVCALVSGCQGSDPPRARRIVPHAMADCEATDSDLVLAALGDFATARAASVDLKASGEVDLPTNLRGVEAWTQPPALRGVGYAEPPADVHLTMWSTSRSCRAAPEDLVPASEGGQAITATDRGEVVVAGLDPPGGGVVSDSAFALVWDSRTGTRALPASLGTHRVARATATPFGGGALIAGGFDRKFLPLRYLATALVHRDGALLEPPIAIGDPRAEHGAVVLASGATLLVGGEDERGVLDSLVTVAPLPGPPYGAADVYGLGALSVARKHPAVMKLSSDEILVAGGVDGDGKYVPTLEWFSPRGGVCARLACARDPPELAEVVHLAFIALPGGGALAAGGNRASGAPSPDVFFIAEDGTVEKLAPLTAQQRGASKVRMVAASDGAPWLWNGRAWLRYDVWRSIFFVPDHAPEDGPDDDMPDPVTVDPGLFLWLVRSEPGNRAARATLRGFRHGVRGPYSHDPEFLLADPQHVVPDRPPHPSRGIWSDVDGLHLSEGARAVIADTTYGDVVVTMEAAGSGLPSLELGSLVIGVDGSCPFPNGAARATVTREHRRVTVRADAGAPRSCAGPEGRVPVALRGVGPEPVTIRRLTISRR